MKHEDMKKVFGSSLLLRGEGQGEGGMNKRRVTASKPLPEGEGVYGTAVKKYSLWIPERTESDKWN